MRLNDGRAVPNFIYQALNNKPLTIYGDGKQTRSFCYVSDLIEGIYLLLMSKENGPVNIGNPGEVSMLELADLITKLANSRSKKVFKPLPADDPKVRCPDISKAKKILKWRPKVKIEEGLKKTIDWFKKHPDIKK
jgi:dTDP-glucose 4,6-dehydratase